MTTLAFPFELGTARLAIRSPGLDDGPSLREAVAESMDALRPWMPWADHVPTPEEALQGCAKAAQQFQEGTDYRVHLFHRSSGLFLGGSGLHRFDWSVPKCEIGYWIRTSCARQGYVTEAVAELTRFAIQELGVKRVEIRMSTRNVESWRVAERLGFSLEGTFRNDARHLDGSLRDTRVYAKTSL